MAKKFLHCAVLFKASNLNYGEGVGNILSLKKLATEGKNYSYISRQALRYDIVRMLKEMYDYKLTPVSPESGVIQFATDATIEDFPEIDFFGYMKTDTISKTRKAVIRLTDAISLEPFHNDMDFGTNKGLADRIEDYPGMDIFQSEIHRSHYCYTVTCNLDQIGKDETYQIDLTKEEKSKRMQSFLNVIKLLYRDIRGKRENLSPLFIIGGLYDVGNPFFYNRINLAFTKEKTLIDADMINDILKIKTLDRTVGEQSFLGHIGGEISNIDDINIASTDVEDFFKTIGEQTTLHYNG